MDTVKILHSKYIGKDFIPEEYLPKGKDEYYLRNSQFKHVGERWRNLRSDEVERLVKNSNNAENWDDIYVKDQFDPDQIKNCMFFGFIRIGNVRDVTLEHHELFVSVGITNSVIISCDIGDDVAIHNVRYLAHYIIGDRCIISNIDEMNTSNHAKFGNGIIKEGENEKSRIWLDLMNETGSRRVMPFDGMISADAYLWAKYREDVNLMQNLKEITQNTFDARLGYYGTIGNQCVIKNSRIIRDVKVGSNCYIKGANKLKNLTINSSEKEPTQIGEGVELVNGIIGNGCHIFYGCKAVRFILGDASNLKYGARLINSFLGDNSTISCCEVLNNLIFPAHEQHHNNSFLVASVLMGQSNLAAGSTVGSNHNSRANDNEVQAGRGFWPGLCVSIKHSCRFASFVLLSKADYPAEMDIPLPFSLLNNNVSKDQLEVLPAFWWTYNMYALARNTWKFMDRDKRGNKTQNIEFDFLAPDTVEEIFSALRLLEIWTAKAVLRKNNQPIEGKDEAELMQIGKEILRGHEALPEKVEILGENMEKSYRKVVITKVHKAYSSYIDMLHYYAVRNIIDYLQQNPEADFASMSQVLQGERRKVWINLGGQICREKDVDRLRADIGAGKLKNWNEIHRRYDVYWERYKLHKQKHAFAALIDLLETNTLSREQWLAALDKVKNIQNFICEQVYLSRKKDFENPFRRATYRHEAEMIATIGTIEDNSFVKQVRLETEVFHQEIENIKKRG